MDVREKLVEQKIKGDGESICYKCFHNKVCKAMDNQPCIECNQFVDANGVTVQEWIPVTERLPDAHCDYLAVVVEDGERLVEIAVFYRSGWADLGGHSANVTHWMPLPQPQKGE